MARIGQGNGQSVLLEQLDVIDRVPDYRRLETILVIEDQQELNWALAVRLEAAGFSVACAHDGIVGLEKMYSLEPDLIVLDLGLPRMHGFKLLHAIRSQPTFEEAPIIVITGNPDPEVEERAERWGISRFFRKPVQLAEVAQAVQDVLKHG